MRVRVSKQQAEENHQQILRAAARLFRERGISATGVDAITKDAGLTHGGLYSQFGSKEAIAVEAIRFAAGAGKRVWERAAQRRGGKQAFAEIAAGYLSREHRDAPGKGCVVAALGPDVARQPHAVRRAFTSETSKRSITWLTKCWRETRLSPRKCHRSLRLHGRRLILARAVSDELSRTYIKDFDARSDRTGVPATAESQALTK